MLFIGNNIDKRESNLRDAFLLKTKENILKSWCKIQMKKIQRKIDVKRYVSSLQKGIRTCR